MRSNSPAPPPTVSAMMPVRNGARFLDAAIMSIRRQTFEDWELVIVDDGSTDNTWDIVQAHARADARIKTRRMKPLGRGAARNECLRHCTGTLVAICDADDVSLPHRFERQVQHLRQHPEVDVVSCSRVIARSERRPHWFFIHAPQGDPSIRQALARNRMPILNASAMIRRALFDTVGPFDERLHRAQDYGFYRRALTVATFDTIDDPLIEYRTFGTVERYRHVSENDLFMRYATHRANGGTDTFAAFAASGRTQLFRFLVMPVRYAKYAIWRGVLGRGISPLGADYAG